MTDHQNSSAPPDWKQDQAETSRLAPARSSADIVDALAKTIWLAGFERAFSRTPTDPWENQAESAKAPHVNTARKIIEAGFVTGDAAQAAVVSGGLAGVALQIAEKIAQLRIYRDTGCQLDHARTIAEGRIAQAEMDLRWVREAMASEPSPAATVETPPGVRVVPLTIEALTEDTSPCIVNQDGSVSRPHSSAATEGARLSNWLADYSHDLKEEGDFDQEAAQLDKASQWIADHLNAVPQAAPETRLHGHDETMSNLDALTIRPQSSGVAQEEDCGCIGAVIGQHERSCPHSRQPGGGK